MRWTWNAHGPESHEIWKQFAEAIGASFVDGGLWAEDKIVAKVDAWTVTLDVYNERVGLATVAYTRIRAAYINRSGLRFRFHEEGRLSAIGKHLGMQDIQVGDPSFDASFVIQGNDEAKVRALFTDATVQGLFEHLRSLQPASLYIEVKDDEGWFGDHFPEGVDELYFQVGGSVIDPVRLKALYDLFAAILHFLCHIDEADGHTFPLN